MAQSVIDVLESMNIDYLKNENMSKHTSFKIGGPAEFYIEPDSIDQLIEIKKVADREGIKCFILGNGSNILVSDSGIEGIVIHIGKKMGNIALLDGETIVCGAGASLMQLCCFARDNSLTGLEFAYGIPGSVGGAIYMNAGAYGGEISDVLAGVSYVGSDYSEKKYESEELGMSYRKSVFTDSNDIILSGTFRLKKGSRESIDEKMNGILQKRKDKQPLNYPSAGSVFKRPEGAFASALIDDCGLKGHNVGDAYVSEKHAGFIVNKGMATCSDVIMLCKDVVEKVFKETGFVLEMEIKKVGKF